MHSNEFNHSNQDSSFGYAAINGLHMYYEIHGSGTPLILVHGGGSTIQTSFGRVIPIFAKNHKVIAVELQAHGHTADIDRPLSFEQDADDVAALMKHLNILNADIFGFSNGASTTLQLAIRHPALVHKMVLGSTFYKKDGAQPWFWPMMANATFEEMPHPFKEAFSDINPDPTALARMYARDVARMQSFPDIPEVLMKNIKAPVFIIIGDADIVQPEHAVEMFRLLSHARLMTLPGGHGDYIGEITTPQDAQLISLTVAIIERFLNESDTKS